MIAHEIFAVRHHDYRHDNDGENSNKRWDTVLLQAIEPQPINAHFGRTDATSG